MRRAAPGMLRALLARPLRPREVWPEIAARPLPGWGGLAVRLAALALLPGLAWAAGLLLGVPSPWVDAEAARTSPALLARGAMVTAVAAFGAVAALAVAVRIVAPMYRGRPDARAAAVVALGTGAFPLVVGVAMVMPVLVLAVLVAALHALTVLAAGAEVLLGMPAKASGEFAVVATAISAVLGLALGGAAGALGWL